MNVHESPVVQSIVWKENEQVQVPDKFQVVSTVFCLEYSCETLEAYFRAVRSACSLIDEGGILIQGGVLDATTYNFGGKTFRCHRLKQAHIIESLKVNCIFEKSVLKYYSLKKKIHQQEQKISKCSKLFSQPYDFRQMVWRQLPNKDINSLHMTTFSYLYRRNFS